MTSKLPKLRNIPPKKRQFVLVNDEKIMSTLNWPEWRGKWWEFSSTWSTYCKWIGSLISYNNISDWRACHVAVSTPWRRACAFWPRLEVTVVPLLKLYNVNTHHTHLPPPSSPSPPLTSPKLGLTVQQHNQGSSQQSFCWVWSDKWGEIIHF